MPTHVVLERTFAAPVSVDDFVEGARRTSWCFELHRVDWRLTCLSLDGLRSICCFTAADAESARLALREAGADTERLWSGELFEVSSQGAANVIVERSFDEQVELERSQAIEDAAAGCLEKHRVTFVATLFSIDRKRMVCFYTAPDAESVRLAQREASMPVDRVWAFRRIGPDDLSRL